MQLESAHFMRTGDVVRHSAGREGSVMDARALYAVVRWDDGTQEEIDQLDPVILVIERASRD